MRTYRRLHLWAGLICSLLILMESVTGLLVTEPWLLGGQAMEARPLLPGGTLTAAFPGTAALNGHGKSDFAGSEKGGSFLIGGIYGTHAGRFGSAGMKGLAEASSIGMILLTGTGIVLSIQRLRVQKRRIHKHPTSAGESE